MLNTVAILIPAYEPDMKLAELVTRLREDFANIVVVDDGSRLPAARAVLSVWENRSDLFSQPVVLLAHEVNRGKGAALKTGFAWIRDHLPEVRTIVTADADGQHLPQDIRRVAEASLGHPEGLVLGVREFRGKVPFRSLFGNFWSRALFRLLTGLSIRDTQTGLRGIPRGLLDRMIATPGERYEYEMRMLVDARRHAAQPLQIGIETVYIAGNKSSHYRPLHDTILTQRALFAARFSS